MATDPNQLDPAWAWAPFAATPDRPWTRRLAAHLYRRAAFGATSAELDEAVRLGPVAAVDRLISPARASAEFDRTMSMLGERTIATGNPQQLSAWWLYRMLHTPDPLLEKLTLFWHGHFATSAAKVEKSRMMLDQNELLRRTARGRFAELVKSVSRDPAMLIYLDSTTNRRIHPNENYARELMELFCLGVGNYTEKEIKEVARAFTGWEVLGERFRFDPVQHDTGSKTFLGKSGNFDGDDAIRIILEQPAAPQFIARKLIRFFVFEEPAASDALVEPIAAELRKREFEIGPAVARILASNLFFSDRAIGRRIRGPVELGVGLLHTLGASTNLVKLAQGLADVGQGVFFPPNVKGWDGGRAWINSATLLGRANLVHQLMTSNETAYAGGNLDTLAARAGAATPAKLVDWLLDLLVAAPVASAAREPLAQLAGSGDGDRNRVIASVIHAISALPEFQLA